MPNSFQDTVESRLAQALDSERKKKQKEYFLAREKAFDELGMEMVESAEKSPKLNPSGKAKFDYYQDPLLGKPLGVVAQPDARHAARLRGVAARK